MHQFCKSLKHAVGPYLTPKEQEQQRCVRETEVDRSLKKRQRRLAPKEEKKEEEKE